MNYQYRSGVLVVLFSNVDDRWFKRPKRAMYPGPVIFDSFLPILVVVKSREEGCEKTPR